MKERPILFSAPMVLALLAGTKTQTRRIVKPTPEIKCFGDGPQAWQPVGGVHSQNWICPYGKPGDRLWVKETCAAYERPENGDDGVVYSADGLFRIIENTEAAGLAWHKLFTIYGKRGAKAPSIFMPRWASRITLEITAVRVERLNVMSKKDAIEEGIERIHVGEHEAWKNYRFETKHPRKGVVITDQQHRILGYESPLASYQSLWESINGPGSWEANPWVWVVEFRRVDA